MGEGRGKRDLTRLFFGAQTVAQLRAQKNTLPHKTKQKTRRLDEGDEIDDYMYGKECLKMVLLRFNGLDDGKREGKGKRPPYPRANEILEFEKEE